MHLLKLSFHPLTATFTSRLPWTRAGFTVWTDLIHWMQPEEQENRAKIFGNEIVYITWSLNNCPQLLNFIKPEFNSLSLFLKVNFPIKFYYIHRFLNISGPKRPYSKTNIFLTFQISVSIFTPILNYIWKILPVLYSSFFLFFSIFLYFFF